jgi:hypothetical protein
MKRRLLKLSKQKDRALLEEITGKYNFAKAFAKVEDKNILPDEIEARFFKSLEERNLGAFLLAVRDLAFYYEAHGLNATHDAENRAIMLRYLTELKIFGDILRYDHEKVYGW